MANLEEAERAKTKMRKYSGIRFTEDEKKRCEYGDKPTWGKTRMAPRDRELEKRMEQEEQ